MWTWPPRSAPDEASTRPHRVLPSCRARSAAARAPSTTLEGGAHARREIVYAREVWVRKGRGRIAGGGYAYDWDFDKAPLSPVVSILAPLRRSGSGIDVTVWRESLGRTDRALSRAAARRIGEHLSRASAARAHTPPELPQRGTPRIALRAAFPESDLLSSRTPCRV